MKKNKIKPIIIGYDDGTPVIGGLFQMHDTMGFPLGQSILECQKRGWVVSLGRFCFDAIKGGWSMRKIKTTIREAIFFTNNGILWPQIEKQLKQIRRMKKCL